MRTKSVVTALLLAALWPAAADAQRGPGGPSGGGPDVARICSQAEQNLGPERFAAVFGSAEGCVAKLTPVAQTAAGECRGEGLAPGSSEFVACMQERIRAAVQAAVGAAGDAKRPAQAGKVCAEQRKKLGAAAFGRRFTSAGACEREAQSALKACGKEAKPGSAAFKACVQGRLKGAGGNAKQASAQAAQACAAMRKQLGASRFERRFAADGGCEPEARAAMKACAADEKPGSAAFKTCVQKALRRA